MSLIFGGTLAGLGRAGERVFGRLADNELRKERDKLLYEKQLRLQEMSQSFQSAQTDKQIEARQTEGAASREHATGLAAMREAGASSRHADNMSIREGQLDLQRDRNASAAAYQNAQLGLSRERLKVAKLGALKPHQNDKGEIGLIDPTTKKVEYLTDENGKRITGPKGVDKGALALAKSYGSEIEAISKNPLATDVERARIPELRNLMVSLLTGKSKAPTPAQYDAYAKVYRSPDSPRRTAYLERAEQELGSEIIKSINTALDNERGGRPPIATEPEEGLVGSAVAASIAKAVARAAAGSIMGATPNAATVDDPTSPKSVLDMANKNKKTKEVPVQTRTRYGDSATKTVENKAYKKELQGRINALIKSGNQEAIKAVREAGTVNVMSNTDTMEEILNRFGG